VIWFVTDVRSGKEYEIEAEHDVCLVFIDAGAKAYLSITARAEVRHDHAKAAEIWKSTDNMWWSGPDDPNVCVLRVRPVTAELWDGPAYAAVAAFEFAKRITGAKPNLGENRKVTVKMCHPSRWRRREVASGRGGAGRRSATPLIGASEAHTHGSGTLYGQWREGSLPAGPHRDTGSGRVIEHSEDVHPRRMCLPPIAPQG
jgi:hypothetical protein